MDTELVLCGHWFRRVFDKDRVSLRETRAKTLEMKQIIHWEELFNGSMRDMNERLEHRVFEGLIKKKDLIGEVETLKDHCK